MVPAAPINRIERCARYGSATLTNENVVKFYPRWDDEDDYTRKLRDDRPVNLVLRVGSADGRALWDSIGADGPCGREEPTPAAPAPARQEQWAACEDDEYVDWAVCDDDDDADHAWEGADAYGAYDM